MRRIEITLALATVALAAALAGCGGGETGKAGKEATTPTTPQALVAQLDRACGMGKAEPVLALLTDDARKQSGKAWVAFLRRTKNAAVLNAIAALPKDQQSALLAAPTSEAFLAKLIEVAPMAAGHMFDMYYNNDIEDEGRVLVYMYNASDNLLALGMQRGEDGGLKLMSEQQTADVFKDLSGKLNEKIRKEQAAEQKS